MKITKNNLKQIITEVFKSSLDEAWDPSKQLSPEEAAMYHGDPDPFGSEPAGAVGFDKKPNVMGVASTAPSETEEAMKAAINAYAAEDADFKGAEELKDEIMKWVEAFLANEFKHPHVKGFDPPWKYSGVKHRGDRS